MTSALKRLWDAARPPKAHCHRWGDMQEPDGRFAGCSVCLDCESIRILDERGELVSFITKGYWE